jgi:hypothetical protein
VIDISRQRREVTACRSHAQEARGAPPLIKAVDRGGVAVPWFAIADYEPYRDYSPTYSLGLEAAALPAEFLDAALALSHAILHRPSDWYADDDWDWDYRTRYWDTTHDRWEREGGWETRAAAPETPLAMGAAPETSFGDRPTAAETAFAAGLGISQAGRAAGGGRAEMDLGGGRDRS